MISLDLVTLGAGYRSGALTPTQLTEMLAERLEREDHGGIWIHRLRREDLLDAARRLERRSPAGPLHGVPFAVKDNIDVAGLPTTAGCPAYAYTARSTAPVVEKLRAAGGLLVGKTNLDQFATGLVGVRSPYGVPVNPFDRRYIVGGSSSGSAAAVARGLVSFALGTDTAGSGRVPAAFTNLVGLKPSRGLLSTVGVVPACPSLDCVSIFALTCEDAAAIAEVARGFDPADPGSRPEADRPRWGAAAPSVFSFGVLAEADREFFGDHEAARIYDAAIERMVALGGRAVAIDFRPFREAAALLYDGPWIAERLAGLEEFVARRGDEMLPVTREILQAGARYTGTQVFRAVRLLEQLRQQAHAILRALNLLLLPTTPTTYTIDEVQADPVRLNARLGLYTNFVNLLNLAAVAVPAGFRADGLPAGVSLIGLPDSDARLSALGAAFHRGLGLTLGATGHPLPPAPVARPAEDTVGLMVVGAHLGGEPLNFQLTQLGARLRRACKTAPCYRLFALPDTKPPKPGLVRVQAGGRSIEGEIWDLPREAVGAFLANVRAPLSIGTVEVDDGERVAGFLCEAYATDGARDISALGGWRRYGERHAG